MLVLMQPELKNYAPVFAGANVAVSSISAPEYFQVLSNLKNANQYLEKLRVQFKETNIDGLDVVENVKKIFWLLRKSSKVASCNEAFEAHLESTMLFLKSLDSLLAKKGLIWEGNGFMIVDTFLHIQMNLMLMTQILESWIKLSSNPPQEAWLDEISN